VSADDRQIRLVTIRNTAVVRAALGVMAHYFRRPDGQHEITIMDRTTQRVHTYTGDTLVEAIDDARSGEEFEP